MQKIVINQCYGGFGLSHKAMMLYAKLSGFKLYPVVEIREKKGKAWSRGTNKYTNYVNEKSKYNPYDFIFYLTKPLLKGGFYENDSWFRDDDIKRDDKNLVKVVEKLGKQANDQYANLKVVKIPEGVKWEISEYDGNESVEEAHRSWD